MRPCIALVFLTIASAVVAQGVGDTVVVTTDDDAELKSDGVVVTTVARGVHLTVERVNGDQFMVTSNHSVGWISDRDVVPLGEAVKFFTDAIHRNPNAVDYQSRGKAWKAQGNIDSAIADYDEAIRLDPEYAVAYNNRGIAWNYKGEHDKAIADYSNAIRLDPALAEAYINRAAEWRRQGEFDNALADNDKAIRLDPEYPVAYNNRGGIWRHKGDYDKAIADYNEAIRLDPEYAVAYINRGIAWGYIGDYDKSIADYSEALRFRPEFAVAYSSRGIAWINKGEYERALADYSEAIRINPKDIDTTNRIAWLLATCPNAAIRDGNKAVELARQNCESTDWKNEWFLDTLAAAYAEGGDFRKAKELETQAITLAADEWKATLRLRLELYEAGMPYRQNPPECF